MCRVESRARVSHALLVVGCSVAFAGPSSAAPTPMPVSPGREAAPTVVEARCPTFSWAGVAGARGYQLAVFRLEAFDDGEPELVARVELPPDARSFTPPVGECLERGASYVWSVAAVAGDDAPLAWSPTFRFEVEATHEGNVEGGVDSVEQAIAVLERYLVERVNDGSEVAASATEARHDAPRPREARPVASGTGDGSDSVIRVASAAAPLPGLTASLAVSGQVRLRNASAIFKEGELFLWDDNTGGNTALGREALESLTTGTGNTAVGRDALRATTGGAASGGSFNTALGDEALLANTTGKRNTAAGADALRANIDGFGNTATGAQALQNNTTGYHNVAIGSYALRANLTGYSNTAVGVYALRSNTSGRYNVAVGTRALADENSGHRNTAIGHYAMMEGTDHRRNTAIGAEALQHITTGDYNTAVGAGALRNTTSGAANVALGSGAGSNNVTGNGNVFIANQGISPATGVDEDTIRIGNITHDRFFAEGVRGVTTGEDDAIPVLIDSDGQLGTESSSLRTKQDIVAAAAFVDRLLALRPVAFRYRSHAAVDPATPLRFGLIAEEVAEVLPELVVFDEQGRPETVKYHLLSSLLLAGLEAQQAELVDLRARMLALEAATISGSERASPRRGRRQDGAAGR